MAKSSMRRINIKGFKEEIDEQGRISIPKKLRDETRLINKIKIEGKEDHLILLVKEN